MTARKRRLRVVLRLPSRADARAPEVCPLGAHDLHEDPVATRPRHLDRLGWTSIVTTHAATTAARTIQRP